MASAMLSRRHVAAGSGLSCRGKSSMRRPVLVRAAAPAAPSIAELHKKHGIEGSVEVVAGNNGLPKVVLKHGCGSSAEVYLYGGCVTSWKQPSGDDVLYVRPDAVWDKSKPISGGIPHCFPQFGPGKIQQHGFARNLDWSISTTSANPNPDDPEPTLELVLSDSEASRAIWPHKFKNVYTVALVGDQLRCDLRVINTDTVPWDFTAALHTYIEVLHVGQAAVRGLKGLKYLDKSADPKNPATKTEDRDAITFTGYTDSVYLGAPDHVELDVGTGAAVSLDQDGWEDVVVWNPHHTLKACYERFVCVESARVGSPVVLQPGESWNGTVTYAVVDLS